MSCFIQKRRSERALHEAIQLSQPRRVRLRLSTAKKAKTPSFAVMDLLTKHNTRWTVSKYHENQIVYCAGRPSGFCFLHPQGQGQSFRRFCKSGKEVVVAIRGPDEFCGEGALTGELLRLTTVTAMTACEIVRLEKENLAGLLHNKAEFLPTISSGIF